MPCRVPELFVSKLEARVPLYPIDSHTNDFVPLSRRYAFRPGARFAGILGPDTIAEIASLRDVHFGRIYTAGLVLYAWLGQAAGPDKTCRSAVLRLAIVSMHLGRQACSTATGGFCRARAKLSPLFVRDLTVRLGEEVEAAAPKEWLYKGRPVILVDGTLIRLPDTPENLKKYPQQTHQVPGTSATSMRLVLMIALATGVLLGAAQGAYKGKGTGEMSLLHELLAGVRSNDLLVGDRYYGSYHLLSMLRVAGADGCFRLSTGRQTHFLDGTAIGGDEDDRIQVWLKPTTRPRGVDAEQWNRVPETILVRVLRYEVKRKGFRCKEVNLVTTLTDADSNRKADRANLYKERWSVELDIRAIKRAMEMHEMTSKTPQRIETDLWVHLLHYNLVRRTMAQAAWDKGRKPREVSFTETARVLNEFGDALRRGEIDEATRTKAITAIKVGNRSGRYEPREVKRQPRKYKERKKARAERREERVTDPEGEKGRKGGGKNRATRR